MSFLYYIPIASTASFYVLSTSFLRLFYVKGSTKEAC